MIRPHYTGSVRELLESKCRHALHNPFATQVLYPLGISEFEDQAVLALSGGQLQRLALVMTLAKPAELYLIDEPSAYLDCEQRIAVARVLKKYIFDIGKTAIIIEHDLMMGFYLADRIMLISGEPGKKGHVQKPGRAALVLNQFLKTIDVTFRHDPETMRPRVNKEHSVKDQEQKKKNLYFDVS